MTSKIRQRAEARAQFQELHSVLKRLNDSANARQVRCPSIASSDDEHTSSAFPSSSSSRNVELVGHSQEDLLEAAFQTIRRLTSQMQVLETQVKEWRQVKRQEKQCRQLLIQSVYRNLFMESDTERLVISLPTFEIVDLNACALKDSSNVNRETLSQRMSVLQYLGNHPSTVTALSEAYQHLCNGLSDVCELFAFTYPSATPSSSSSSSSSSCEGEDLSDLGTLKQLSLWLSFESTATASQRTPVALNIIARPIGEISRFSPSLPEFVRCASPSPSSFSATSPVPSAFRQVVFSLSDTSNHNSHHNSSSHVGQNTTSTLTSWSNVAYPIPFASPSSQPMSFQHLSGCVPFEPFSSKLAVEYSIDPTLQPFEA